jgi:hypothetical protein
MKRASARCDRISAGAKDNGYGSGRGLRRQRRSDAVCYDYRDAATDEIGCERRQTVILIFRPAVFDRHVLTRDIAGFLQALEKWNGDDLVVKFSGLEAEEPNHRHRRLLRLRSERPRRRAPEPRDERSAPH